MIASIQKPRIRAHPLDQFHTYASLTPTPTPTSMQTVQSIDPAGRVVLVAAVLLGATKAAELHPIIPSPPRIAVAVAVAAYHPV